jgi:predicted anti-sigma-YlaC factor YlaD
MLRCREVVRLVASDELASSGWMRRLAVRMHLTMCRHCRRYAKQVRDLGRVARRIWPAAGIEDGESIRRIEDAMAARIGSLSHRPEEPPAAGKPPPLGP